MSVLAYGGLPSVPERQRHRVRESRERGFAELVRRVSERDGWYLSEAVTRTVLKRFGEEVLRMVARDGRLTIPGFGTFIARTRKARYILNPQTQERMRLPAQKSVGFRLAKRAKYPRRGKR